MAEDEEAERKSSPEEIDPEGKCEAGGDDRQRRASVVYPEKK